MLKELALGFKPVVDGVRVHCLFWRLDHPLDTLVDGLELPVRDNYSNLNDHVVGDVKASHLN